MSTQNETEQVRTILQKFQDGYTTRDKSKLDEFMELFAPTDEIELIGVGASERGTNPMPARRASRGPAGW